MIADFHLLRPLWLLALLPLLLMLWYLHRRSRQSRSWQQIIDPQLQPYVLTQGSPGRRGGALFAIATAGLLAILALAGPSWQKLEQPVYRQQSALVILLDLSRSMDATDLRPSRLERARLKLHDLLQQRQEGQTALIVFAANAFVVTPLTDDTHTISSQLAAMTSDLMPSQGSRPDQAIRQALQLLRASGINRGSVLLISDGVDAEHIAAVQQAAAELATAGHQLQVIGVGSQQGAPIPNGGRGFIQDKQGNIVIARLQRDALQQIAASGHGHYQDMRIDEADIQTLLQQVQIDHQARQPAEPSRHTDQWLDQGAWLLLPLVLLASLAFRRGCLAALLLTVWLLPQSQPAMALDWQQLWQTADQRGQQAMQQQDYSQAAKQFNDPAWQAAAEYRAGNYQAAEQILQTLPGDQAAYNRGNALARQNRLAEAIEAYQQALTQNPDNQDAQYNLERVKQWQQQQQQSQDNSPDESSSSDDSSQAPSPSEQKSSQSSSEQQPSNTSPGDAQHTDQSSKHPPKNTEQATANPASSEQQPKDDPTRAEQQPPSQDQTDNQAQQPSEKATQTAQSMEQPPLTDSEQQQASEQWLRRIPDDPGGLWRRKFLYQHQKTLDNQHYEEKAW